MSRMSKKDVCRRCMYFEVISYMATPEDEERDPLLKLYKDTGFCHVGRPMMGRGGFGVWPRVEFNKWCGSFREYKYADTEEHNG